MKSEHVSTKEIKSQLIIKEYGESSNDIISLSKIPTSELSEIFCPICDCQQRKLLRKEREFPIWRCKRCRHIYVSPQPSEAVLFDYYAKGFMPKTEDENIYEGRLNRVYDSIAKAIVKFIPQRGDLLDIGAGFGGFLCRAEKDGWNLIGIELSDSAFEVCQRRLGNKVQILKVPFEKADLPHNSVDCIVMLNVIEHLRDPVNVCKRAFQILRPGGCLALRWPQHIYNQNLAPPAHLHEFTRYSIEELFRVSGFTEITEYWTEIQDYRNQGYKKYLQAKILRLLAKIFFTCSFGKRQIPFVTRLTLGRKPF
jgi:SAM-dependent methyltransferase